MLNSAVAFLTLVTPVTLFRLLIRDFSSTAINHSKLWHRCKRKWTSPLVNCLMDMNSSLFLKPDVILDLRLRLSQSLAPSGSSSTAMVLIYTMDLFVSSGARSIRSFVCDTGYGGKADFWPVRVLFNAYLTNPGGHVYYMCDNAWCSMSHTWVIPPQHICRIRNGYSKSKV
jgi:hypothetical protein